MKYYYLCGIGIEDINSSSPGSRYLDFLIEWDSADYEEFKELMIMVKNKLWETSMDDVICKDSNLFYVLKSINPALIRSKINKLITCVFNSNQKMSREELESLIKFLPEEKIKQAKI